MLLLENCRLFNDLKRSVSVLIENTRIAEITEENLDCENTLDCNEKILLPGAIDGHVHFRVPGFEHKEDWLHGSKAAIAGGITTVLEMPNTIPPTTSVELLEEKRLLAARDSYCNFGFFFGATPNNEKEVLLAAERIAGVKLYYGSTTGNLLVERDEDIRRVFENAKKKNLLVAVHAEHEQTMKKNIEKAKENFWNHAKYHSKIRTEEVEAIAVEKLLAIQGQVGNKLHFCHLSTAIAAELVLDAKKEGYWVTAEVCPQYLFLDEQATERIENFAKVNPSLKDKENTKGLWKMLSKGAIDSIATDHAPHTIAEKMLAYYDAPSGIPGCQTMLPLLLDALNKNEISLEKIVELCCKNPAKIFGIKERGEIKEGDFADLSLVDLKAEQEISNEKQYSKCKWTPFNGWRVKGKVLKTIVNGSIAFDDESFFETRGMEVF